MSASNNQMKIAYKAGMRARNNAQMKSTCPYGSMSLNLRCQWLAGWNDADIEDYL